MLKTALSKIAHGLLIGVGFAAALGALLFGYAQWQIEEFEERTGMSTTQEDAADAGLVIKDHRPQRSDGNSAFLGTIVNNGSSTRESVELLVELFDKDGAFVDKCSSYLDGSIGPGQTRNFKVSCSNCRDPLQPLAYDRYTIVIADAGFSSPNSQAAN